MRIKTVVTLGPASNSYQTMKALAENGARIFRLNFSHSSAADFVPVVKQIRQLEEELGFPLTVMGDLCGPKTRIGTIKKSPMQVGKGEYMYLGLPDMADKVAPDRFIPLDFPQLLAGLERGMPVSLSDGMLCFHVAEVLEKDRLFKLEAENDNILTSNKGIAFPGKFHPIPALTDKDRKDLREGIDIGLDAVALSFVQTKQDITDIKEAIAAKGVWLPVIAKIERQTAVEQIDSILELADGIMIARGDLGLECPPAMLPIIQKKILRACRHAQKPAIVATQMLLSMVKNPVPTRAETTDVANAILDGADCVMLSEETAIGAYPVEAVRLIQDIAGHAEAYFLERTEGPYKPKKEKNPAKYMAYAACLIADNVDSEALVCHSTSGTTAKMLSSRRPAQPIYALTPKGEVMCYLNFYWGVQPRLVDTAVRSHLIRVENFVQQNSCFSRGRNVVLTSGQPTPGQESTSTNEIKVYYK